METATDPLVGRLLDGRYLIDRRIARGGMATVYQATDTRLQRTVAVKVMHAALAEDAEFVKRFRREARSAARLSHPNVVAVFDQGADGQIVYLTMEYVAGRTLRQVLHESGALSPVDALELLDPILRALSAAHQAGLVHRDVKPENVLIGEDGSVKVADFGVARAVSSATTTATQGLLIGTVSYLAPEQLTHGNIDARADVYSTGILLYEMLAGHKPHDGQTPIQVAYLHVNVDVPAPSEAVPGTPRFVDGLVLRATARDADVRPPDAGVFLQHVRRAHAALLQGVDDHDLAEDLLSFQRTDDSVLRGQDATLPVPVPVAEPDATTAQVVPLGSVAPVPRPERTPARLRALVANLPALNDPAGRRGLAVLALMLALVLIAGLGVWWLGIARYTHVPSVLEVDPSRLEQLEDETGLHFKVAGRDYSETIAKGLIMRSEPEPSDRIRKGSTVEVWVSRGPERYEVPDLQGVSSAEAQRMIPNNNLSVNEVVREYSDTQPRGTVIRTDPPAGERLRRDALVTLVVSRGPEPVEIPSVTGQERAAAEATLTAAGFEVDVEEVFDDTAPVGQVVSQDPGPGMGHRGDRITIGVSKGPAFTAVPNVLRWNLTDAENHLRALGFTVESRQAGIYVGLNVVVTQAPAGDTMAPTGSVITLEYA